VENAAVRGTVFRVELPAATPAETHA
jgi:hypothetical protein